MEFKEVTAKIRIFIICHLSLSFVIEEEFENEITNDK